MLNLINISSAQKIATACLASLIICAMPHQALSQQTAQDAPQIIALEVKEIPRDEWAKNRLVPKLADKGLQLVDETNGEFNDASFWQIVFNEPLPYGRKIFSVTVEIADDHEALWGGALIQPVINGKEGTPATDEGGKASFEKIIGGDGKGFIPAKSGSYSFELPKSERTMGIFAFMTAGAKNFDLKLKDFKVTAWPEEDTRLLEQRPYMSKLGYRPEDRKTLLVELWDDEESLAAKKITVNVEGPGGAKSFEAAIPEQKSMASESRVSELDLSEFSKPGQYTATVQAFGKRTQPGKVSFDIVTGLDHILKNRDQAWGAFYWITDDEHGPFPDAHKQDAAAKIFGDETATRDVRGGWLDAGDYGKYSVNGAYSIGLMLLTGLIAPETMPQKIDPLAGGSASRADWLDVVESQLRWLLKMQAPDGGVNHKATTKEWPALNITPQQDEAVKWLMPVTSTATADFAAIMSLAAMTFQDLPGDDNKQLAETYRAAAEKAREWLAQHPNLVMIEKRYDNFEYGGPYDDTSDDDERFFADAAYAALTKDTKALGDVSKRLAERAEALQKDNHFIEWGKVDLLGFWALKAAGDLLPEEARTIVDGALQAAAEYRLQAKKDGPWNIGKRDDSGFEWGSNSIIATSGWHWLLWAHVGGDANYVTEALDQMHYFFGRNPLGQTYVTGVSAKAAKDPHFRPSQSGAIKLPAGFLVGGPNSVYLAGDPTSGILIGQPPMRRYVDDKEGYATNEVAINWQSTWALYNSLLLAALEKQ